MREKGILKWFGAEQGFAFIECSSGKAVFVDHSVILIAGQRTLEEGTQVECEAEPGPMGLRAISVCTTERRHRSARLVGGVKVASARPDG